MNTYLLFKSIHLIAVISWMAGLLYLPRIFVYHSEAVAKNKSEDFITRWTKDISPTEEIVEENTTEIEDLETPAFIRKRLNNS